MKTRIHINRQNIQANKKNSNKLPVITAKNYKVNRLGNSVVINGPSRIIYSPDKPLKCGAYCWIETESEVLVYD